MARKGGFEPPTSKVITLGALTGLSYLRLVRYFGFEPQAKFPFPE